MRWRRREAATPFFEPERRCLLSGEGRRLDNLRVVDPPNGLDFLGFPRIGSRRPILDSDAARRNTAISGRLKGSIRRIEQTIDTRLA